MNQQNNQRSFEIVLFENSILLLYILPHTYFTKLQQKIKSIHKSNVNIQKPPQTSNPKTISKNHIILWIYLTQLINKSMMDCIPRVQSNEPIENLSEGKSNKNESISPPSQTVNINHFEVRIQEAINIKNEGNVEFKARRYDQARNVYQRALALLQPNTFYGATEAQCVKMAELSANLLFNIGSCFFNQSKWRQAELIYNEAIVVNPYYIKAIYKRALARFELQEFEGAMADIKQAFNLDKTNKEIYDSYEKILIKYNEAIKKQREKSKELSQKIFNSSKVKPKQTQVVKSEKKEELPGNNWWMVPLVSLVGLGVYTGIKYFRK